MDLQVALRKVRILRRHSEDLMATQKALVNTLTVLEKELEGGGAPSNSKKQEEFDRSISNFLAKRDKRRKRKPRGNGASH